MPHNLFEELQKIKQEKYNKYYKHWSSKSVNFYYKKAEKAFLEGGKYLYAWRVMGVWDFIRGRSNALSELAVEQVFRDLKFPICSYRPTAIDLEEFFKINS